MISVSCMGSGHLRARWRAVTGATMTTLTGRAHDRLMSISWRRPGQWTHARVPAVASTSQNALVRLGIASLILRSTRLGQRGIDTWTKSRCANEGIIKVSAVGLFNAKTVTQRDGFWKQQTQHA